MTAKPCVSTTRAKVTNGQSVRFSLEWPRWAKGLSEHWPSKYVLVKSYRNTRSWLKRSWSHCDTRIVQFAAYTPTTHRQSHKTRLFPHLTCPHPVIHLTHCVFETSGRDYARCPVQ